MVTLKSALRSAIFLLCCVLTPAPGNDRCLEELAAFAYQSDHARTPESTAYWRAYKAQPCADGKVTNLSVMGEECGPMVIEPHANLPFGLTLYERDLLLLQAGERVMFDDESFVLDAFMGAGNSVQVWKLFDVPEAAIRLARPERLDVWGIMAKQPSVINAANAYAGSLLSMKNFEDGESKIPVEHVNILKRDPLHRYAVVSLVHGCETALPLIEKVLGDFRSDEWEGLLELDNPVMANILARLTQQYGRNVTSADMAGLINTATAHFYEIQQAGLSEHERKQFRQLLEVNRTFRLIPYLIPDFDETGEIYAFTLVNGDIGAIANLPVYEVLRQFVWDTQKERWIMVDWDGDEVKLFERDLLGQSFRENVLSMYKVVASYEQEK